MFGLGGARGWVEGGRVVAGLGVALEPPHTCRRLLGEVELHAVHLGDQAAGAPGMVEACAYGMNAIGRSKGVGTRHAGTGRLGHGTAQAPRLDFEPCVPA